MALLAPLVWEVRAGAGAATNGGAFDPTSGTPGTDYSQQDAAQISWLAAGGTYTNDLNLTNATPSVATSAALTAANGTGFLAAHVGNIINVTAGTNVTAGRYQIISVAGGEATLDRIAVTGAPSADGSGYLGGAVASIDTIYNVIVAGNTVYIKSGNDSITAARTLTSGTIVAPITIAGYTSSRGDLVAESWSTAHNSYGFLTTTGYPVIACADNLLTLGTFTRMSCISVTSTRTAGNGLTAGTANALYRCVITNSGNNASAIGCTLGTRATAVDCEFYTTGASSSRSVGAGTMVCMHGCRITSTAGNGFQFGTSGIISSTLVYDIAAGKTGVICPYADELYIVLNCTFDRCAGTAISMPNQAQTSGCLTVVNCVGSNGTKFADNLRSATQEIPVWAYYNRLRDMSSGNYTGWYANSGVLDITTDADDDAEYVDVAHDDYHLKSTSLAKSAGTPASFDCGCWQRAEPTLPADEDVQDGVTYGDGGTQYTGTFTAPAEGDVEDSVQYGGDGTEYTGTFAVPAEEDVENGVGYGEDGTEFTGTLVGGGGGGGPLADSRLVR
jgi:hypothetical protein